MGCGNRNKDKETEMATVTVCDICGGQYEDGFRVHAGSLRVDPKTRKVCRGENADLCSRDCVWEWLGREQSGARDTPVSPRQS